MEKIRPYKINTISDFHKLIGAPAPDHPLISVIKIEPFEHIPEGIVGNVVNGFYSISLKKGFKKPVKFKYGQQSYDFDEGVLSFMSPGQIGGFDPGRYASAEQSGWLLLFHPDFLWNTPLARKINDYGFFDYAVNEALFLSEKEEGILLQIVGNILQEYHNNMDKFSHGIICTQLESLFKYSERFYNRQFITRKITSHQILDSLDDILSNYFIRVEVAQTGLPTVAYLAEKLKVSPDYLSGLLKSITGMNTQQHIHEKLINEAKQQLSTTNLSVSEIAYKLGFEHSQSFSKLFKAKTSISPMAFKSSFL